MPQVVARGVVRRESSWGSVISMLTAFSEIRRGCTVRARRITELQLLIGTVSARDGLMYINCGWNPVHEGDCDEVPGAAPRSRCGSCSAGARADRRRGGFRGPAAFRWPRLGA